MATASAPEQVGAFARPFVFFCRALSFGLFPVALAPPVPLPWPDWGAMHPACPYMLLVLVAGAIRGAHRTARTWALGWPVCLFLVALLALQALAMHASVIHWEVRPVDAAGPYGQLLIPVVTLLVYALGLRLLCAVPGGPTWLARGAIFSLLLLLGVCGLQLAWLLTGPEFQAWLGQGIVLPTLPDSVGKAAAALHERLTSILHWSGAWLEARSVAHPDPIYENGAYTLTVLRINGVFATASDLAVILAVTYVPLVLAGLSTAGVWGRRVYVLLAGAMIVVLIGGRSPTAFVACLFLLHWLGRALWAAGRRGRAFLVMLLVVGLGVGAACHDPASRRLAARMWEPGAAPLPEETVVWGTWELVREYPWTGVGYGWSAAYVIHGESYAQTPHTDEEPELQAWREDTRALPAPSLLLEFLATFGMPLALAVVASFCWLWLRLRRLVREIGEPERRFALAAALPYLQAMAIFVSGDMDWTHPLPLLPCFGLWAMVGVWERQGSAATSGRKATGAAPAGKRWRVSPAARGEARISDSPSRPFTLSGGG
ncbi:MAG: hypothetical protein LBC10_00585 [Deltaproteobacteria bacterium]|jgi:hypothetical protein|nr:hypothetical protein [Deltaproteobacteria bacterium]